MLSKKSGKTEILAAFPCSPLFQGSGCPIKIVSSGISLAKRPSGGPNFGGLNIHCWLPGSAGLVLAFVPGASGGAAELRLQPKRLTQTVGDESGRELACQTQRAAAAPLSSGRVLKAMAACGAARWMALTTASNRTSRLGGRRRPAPITMQSQT